MTFLLTHFSVQDHFVVKIARLEQSKPSMWGKTSINSLLSEQKLYAVPTTLMCLEIYYESYESQHFHSTLSG